MPPAQNSALTKASRFFWGMAWATITTLFVGMVWDMYGGSWGMVALSVMIPFGISAMLLWNESKRPVVNPGRANLRELERRVRKLDLEKERLDLLTQEARSAEANARQQTHRLWEAFFQLNHPAGFLDVQGNILDVNASAIETFGQPAEQIRGKNITHLEVLGDGQILDEQLHRAGEGETVQFQIELKDIGQGAHVLVMSLKPVMSEGVVELLILEGHDITERVKAEEALQETFTQFQQSQKMEAIGRLAGGIAHDFNNLLASILGFSNMALEALDPEDEVSEDLQEVVLSANRAQSLTQKLLALARKDIPESQPTDLNKLLRDMDNLLRVTLHENLELVVEMEDAPCVIQVDPTSMEQVIVNLAVNARDAMPRSGRLFIKTELCEFNEHEGEDEGLDPGEYVKLSIRDTGYGMDPDILEHAFEPFFTTKESGQGTGLGLSTVYAIIKQYKGAIQVKSEAGVGTEFQIYIPRYERTEQLELNLPGNASKLPDPKGKETILLVEDEDGVRRMACKMLESLGYTLITACDGEEGVHVAHEHQGSIDLIITDVVMPNLSGPEMIDRIRLDVGDIPHLYVSGFTMDKLKEHGADGSEQMLIRKPYTRETLARRIRATIDGEILPEFQG